MNSHSQERLAANLAVTQILAESPALSDAIPRVLQTVGQTLGWKYGGLWTIAPEGQHLRCLTIWNAPACDFTDFREMSLKRKFSPGIGLPGRVWVSRHPSWIPDVTRDANFPRLAAAASEGLRAAFAFPVMSGLEFFGVMEFFSDEIRQPDGDLLKMFAGIGMQIGQFIERKQGEEAMIHRVNEQTALYEFTDRLYRASSLSGIYNTGLDSIMRALGCDRASILLFDDTHIMRFVGWRGLSDGYRQAVEGHSPWKPNERDPQPICISDIDEADIPDALKAVVKGEGIRALAFIPLMVEGRLLGKFMTYYNQPHMFAKQETALALTIGRQLAFAVDSHRTQQALRQSQEQLEAELADSKLLQSISAAFIEEENTHDLYEKIIDAAVTIMRSDFASMQMLYPDRGPKGELRLLSFRGLTPEAAKFWEWVNADCTCSCGIGLRTGKRTVMADVETYPYMDPQQLKAFRQTGIRSAQTTPLVSRGGKVLGMISTHWARPHQPSERDLRLFDILARQAADLIERKRSQEELRRSEQHLELLSNTVPALISYVGPDYRYITCNDAYNAWFGLSREKVIGSHMKDVLGDDMWKIVLPKMELAFSGETVEYETYALYRYGGVRWISAVYSPHRRADGSVMGVVIMVTDISQSKKAEQALAVSNKELQELTMVLEERVKERTQLLEDQAGRLRQLAVELTEVEQKERRRLAEVLHDHLQQYLVAAKLRLDLLERKAADPDKKGLDDARSYIDKAVHSSRHLTAELRPLVLYEGGLAAGLRYLVRKMENRHKIMIQLTASEDAEPASDFLKVMIYQCVQELLFNGVKYSGVDEFSVTVSRLEDNIQATVEDGGRGFDVEQLGKKGQGGFGLFSIRERMKAMGGQLNISSTPGLGSKFTIIVPDKPESSSIKETSMPKKLILRERSRKEGIVVLVADDHLIIRQSIASLLDSQPFIKEVVQAGNGEEAIRQAESIDPDVVLMDINMPVMNGIEATQLLSDRNPRSKVIGLSVQSEVGMAQAMKEAGAVAYFNKGDDTETLIEAIKKFAVLQQISVEPSVK